MERLAQWWERAAEAIARRAGTPGAGGFTPTDLDLVALDQGAIEVLEDRYPELSDVWPLSPMQRGMMFHSELSADAADAYLVQLVLELDGAVEVPRLQRAAHALLGRHANLRTAFVRTPGGDAVQVVQGAVDVPWSEIDLREHSEPEAAARMRELLGTDRATAFDLSHAPLLRITLVHMPGGAERLVVTNHHILFDGWSTPLLLEDLFALYARTATRRGSPHRPRTAATCTGSPPVTIRRRCGRGPTRSPAPPNRRCSPTDRRPPTGTSSPAIYPSGSMPT